MTSIQQIYSPNKKMHMFSIVLVCSRLIPQRFFFYTWDDKNRHEMTQRSSRKVDTRRVALRREPSGPKSVAVPDVADIDQDRVEAVDAAR